VTPSGPGKAGADRRRGILMIVENLPVPFDRRVWSEATTLRDAGYEVTVICPKGVEARESYVELHGVHIYRHPLPIEAKGAIGYVLEYASALFYEFVLAGWVLCRRGFDVIHACNPPDTIFLIGGFFKLLLAKKFVFDQHDINPELYQAKFGRKDFFYRLLTTLERLTFRIADISIATNQSYRRIAIERGGMPPERVYVVRSGPRLDWLIDMPAVPALRCGRRYLVGYVGVIGGQEGLDLLIEAVKYIVKTRRRDDIQFRVIGDGPALAEMIALAEQSDVSEFVTFTGRLPDRDVLEMLNTADVCVNPDRVNEMNDKSTMNKIMEYMALGRPIVQFDVIEGRISALDASLYAKPNDAIDFAERILTLLDDPERRQSMGAFGRERVREVLSWEHQAPRLLEAYASLFASTGAANSSLASLAPPAPPASLSVPSMAEGTRPNALAAALPANPEQRLPVVLAPRQ
jgi:glycosyltransferase involved in cell wall biosynthesis